MAMGDDPRLLIDQEEAISKSLCFYLLPVLLSVGTLDLCSLVPLEIETPTCFLVMLLTSYAFKSLSYKPS